MMLTTPKWGLPLLIIVYAAIGFVVPNALVEVYFHGKHLMVDDAEGFIRKPLIDAAMFAVGICVIYYLFTMVNKYDSLKKEMIFHVKFLLTNTVLLLVILYLSSRDDVRLNESVVSVTVDYVNFYPYYITSTLISFIILFFLRKKKSNENNK
ncbi:hypothetical protein [Yersinia similis]|nr:hypothetical protein [Yersinia similis]